MIRAATSCRTASPRLISTISPAPFTSVSGSSVLISVTKEPPGATPEEVFAFDFAAQARVDFVADRVLAGSHGAQLPDRFDRLARFQRAERVGPRVRGFGTAGGGGAGAARVGRGQDPDRAVGAGEFGLGIVDREGDARVFALLALDVDGHGEGGHGLLAGVLDVDLHQRGLADDLFAAGSSPRSPSPGRCRPSRWSPRRTRRRQRAAPPWPGPRTPPRRLEGGHPGVVFRSPAKRGEFSTGNPRNGAIFGRQAPVSAISICG